MKNLKPLFQDLEAGIRAARWFTDDWTIYNRGVYLQLAKTTWHNQDQGGIHFETSIEAPQIKAGLVPISLHVETDVPAADVVAGRLRAVVHDRFDAWKGYKLGSGGYLVCERQLPLHLRQLPSQWREEFHRLQALVPLIDAVLADPGGDGL